MKKKLFIVLVIGLLLIGLVIAPQGHCDVQVYQVTAPITTVYGDLALSDLGCMTQGKCGGMGLWANNGLTFGNLMEVVYIDTTAGTVRQEGFVQISAVHYNAVLNETRTINGQAVTGVLTVHQEIVGGGVSFDTGAVPMIWDNSTQVWNMMPAYGYQDSLPNIPVSGWFSLDTGGQTHTESFSYALNMMSSLKLFWQFAPSGDSTTLTLGGLGGGIATGGDFSRSFTADNGYRASLITGMGDGTDWISWSSGPVTANRVPEPTTMLLLGIGLMGLAGVRRKFKN